MGALSQAAPNELEASSAAAAATRLAADRCGTTLSTTANPLQVHPWSGRLERDII